MELELPSLAVMRARLTYRLLEDATLPESKANMLRGGFGYAFQRASCPPACWNRSEQCEAAAICPFRWVFATPHPPGVAHLHDLQDVPRPFVIEPPLDGRRRYAAGDSLEFGLTIIGRGLDYLPYFLFAFARLGDDGLTPRGPRARLERVEALAPFQPVGRPIYQDGRVLDAGELPALSLRELAGRARDLPPDLRLALRTPLRVKSRGSFIEHFDLGAIVQAACWRVGALATFHGDGPWRPDTHRLAGLAAAVPVAGARVRWDDWERVSHRGASPRTLKLGGLVGEAVLRDVPAPVRAVLLAAGLVHVGKGCVFGHGKIDLSPR